MGRKILVLCGSPNKDGNTNTVVEWFKEEAEKGKAVVELVDVTRLKYKVNGCTACMGCQKSDKFECVIKDEASPILARILEYDILVFATPVYFFGPTAQLKIFMDRMYSLFKFTDEKGGIKHALKNTEFALIATAGSDGFSALRETFNIVGGFMGAKVKSLLIPFAGNPGDIKNNAQAEEKARLFARKLTS